MMDTEKSYPKTAVFEMDFGMWEKFQLFSMG